MNADFVYVFNATKGIIQSMDGGAMVSLKVSGPKSVDVNTGMRMNLRLTS